MANYCYNRLSVRGKKADIAVFKKALKHKGNHLAFSKTVPIPAELEGTDSPSTAKQMIRDYLNAKYGADNWYDWQLRKWGCKWGTYNNVEPPGETIHKNTDVTLTYHFDTPWSPPSEWVRNTSAIYPKLRFSNYCDEPGAGFKGTEAYKAGQLIKSTIK
jgi:hypothetical protein